MVDGIMKPINTTKGWNFQIEWKDGSMSWPPVSIVK